MKISVYAPAKVNLTLDILNRRSDGYHNIKTIMQSISLYDTVILTENKSHMITVECTNLDVPCNENNIACKAVRAFYKRLGAECGGLHISIEKNIPMQAGLAGGSADGAAVLVGLNKLCGEPFTAEQTEEIGSEVGADVPFCVRGGTVLAQGTGTLLTSLDNIPKCYFVLVKPPIGISTAEAYRAADKREITPESSTDKMLSMLSDIKNIGKYLHNDFEAALSNSDLFAVKSDILACEGALGACMSGSGSTVFGLFENKNNAGYCSEALRRKYNDVFIAQPLAHGCSIL